MLSLAIIIFPLLATGLSILTDGSFFDLLDKIGNYYKIPSNLIAASLMAIASSAPELSASIVDTFWYKNHIGIGTIIGSAIFNLLVIIGFSGLFSKQPLLIQKNYIIRDMMFYILTILILVAITFTQENTVWNMLFLVNSYFYYLVYLGFQIFTQPIDNSNKIQSKRTWSTLAIVFKAKRKFRDSIQEKEVRINIPNNLRNDTQLNPIQDPRSPQLEQTTLPEKIKIKENTTYNIYNIFISIIYQPWNILFTYTISQKHYFIGFLMCCFWTITITYGLVWCCNIFSHVLNIPPHIAGLLILAPTTSLPDTIASVEMARSGKGSDAISNAIGSNIFDIAIGHGLPHFIYCLIWGIQNTNITPSGIRSLIALGISIIVTLMGFYWNRWKLDKYISILLLVTYLTYVIVECILQA